MARKLTVLALLILALMIIWLNAVYSAPIATGQASWYNTESCQKEGTSGVLTASGERFDGTDLTCAMRSHDFGKYYMVCAGDDNCVVVRHNDYGPNQRLYDAGRIIDLSEAAFASIANPDIGVITVTIYEVEVYDVIDYIEGNDN